MALAVLFILPAALPCFAGAAGGRLAREQRNLDRATSALQKAQQAFDKAESELRRAEAGYATASNAFQRASQAAAKKYSDRFGLPAAAAAVKEAEANVEAARQTFLSRLEERPDYQAAERKAKTASDDLLKLKEDKSLLVSEYEDRSRLLSAAIREPLEIQRRELARDPAHQAALGRVQKAEERLAELEARYKRAFAAEPAALQARQELTKTEKTLASARQRATQASQALADARAKVASEQQALQQIAAQPRLRRR